jgi:hypothetical protein
MLFAKIMEKVKRRNVGQKGKRNMVVIKGKEKKENKRIIPAKHGMTARAKKILKRPQDNQPIAAVAVS